MVADGIRSSGVLLLLLLLLVLYLGLGFRAGEETELSPAADDGGSGGGVGSRRRRCCRCCPPRRRVAELELEWRLLGGARGDGGGGDVAELGADRGPRAVVAHCVAHARGDRFALGDPARVVAGGGGRGGGGPLDVAVTGREPEPVIVGAVRAASVVACRVALLQGGDRVRLVGVGVARVSTDAIAAAATLSALLSAVTEDQHEPNPREQRRADDAPDDCQGGLRDRKCRTLCLLDLRVGFVLGDRLVRCHRQDERFSERLTLRTVASACALCAALAADLIAADALSPATERALEKLAPMDLVMLAMLSDKARLALSETDRIASSARRDASAEACDMDREADSAAFCCPRALASCCSVWLSRWVACCSDWLSCWLDWLTC